MGTDFYNLEPHLILKSVEDNGFKPTGEIHQLNSYENRVFDIKLENQKSLIAKFFRPQRWSRSTLADEHKFCLDLQEEGLSVGTPFSLKDGTTVGETSTGILFAFYNKVRGRMMQEIRLNQFEQLGKNIAHLHNVGEKSKANHRFQFGPTGENKWILLDQLYEFITPEVRDDYLFLAEDFFIKLDHRLQPEKYIRIHGDLHRGNLLESEQGDLALVDFDDFLNGPILQDFWMIFPDQDWQSSSEFELFLKGYTSLRHFDQHDLELVPLLRAYRIICYAGWILNRWKDPSFPKIFPQFGSFNYWAEELEALRRLT